MATTTPNFGWAVPTSTDLVKDGAVAIETLGDSIDASLVDLKGGTTGQVLAKASNTDMDFSWVAQDDSNAIQNALLTTTGDTIYASGASTPARLGIGSTGQVLTVAAGVPTWATPAGGTPAFVGCSLTKSTAQSIASGTETIVTYDTEVFDTDGFHSTVTNTGRITIPTGKAGKYLFTAQLMIDSSTFQTQGVLRKNGSGEIIYYAPKSPTAPCVIFSAILPASVGDYFETVAYQGSGTNKNVLGNNYTPNASFFSAQYLGA